MAIVVKDGSYRFVDFQEMERLARATTASILAKRKPAPGREKDGHRTQCRAPMVLKSKAKTVPLIYGTDKVVLDDPGCADRCVAHSSQRCVEELIRRRDPLDYAYVAASTMLRPTGCGAAVLEVIDRLPGEPGRTTTSRRRIYSKREARDGTISPRSSGRPRRPTTRTIIVLVGCGEDLDRCTTANGLTSRRNVD